MAKANETVVTEETKTQAEETKAEDTKAPAKAKTQAELEEAAKKQLDTVTTDGTFKKQGEKVEKVFMGVKVITNY